MNIGWLETFARVVELGNISEGAKELNLTQPAVSKQIKNLEQYYGVQLLDRSNRESRPTEAGKFVYYQAKEILGKMVWLREEIAIFQTELRGRVRIGASTIPGEYILPRQIACFHRKYPYVQLNLEIGDSEGIIQSLKKDKYDFAVIGSIMDSKGIHYQEYALDQVVAVAHAEHPLKNRGKISPNQLIGETIIWREEGSGTRSAVEERLSQLNLNLSDLSNALQLGSTEAIINAVETGVGISFVSQRAVKERGASKLTILDLEGFPVNRTLYLATNLNRNISDAAQKMIDFLLQEERITTDKGRE